MFKRFSVLFSCSAALVLAAPMELSAYWEYDWVKKTDGVWEDSWPDPAGHGYSALLCRYGAEDRPVAVSRCPIIRDGESFSYPCAPEDWENTGGQQPEGTHESYRDRFSGYLLLREEIKEWLWRLGVVEEGPGRVTFHHNLTVSYVIHHQPEGFNGGFQTTWCCWDPNNAMHPVAIRFVRLSEAQISWIKKADQVASRPVQPSSASLPNGFLKRELPQKDPQPTAPQTVIAKETHWWETQVIGDVDFDRSDKDVTTDFYQNFSFAALIVQPGGDVEVIIETLLNQDDFGAYFSQLSQPTPEGGERSSEETDKSPAPDLNQETQVWLDAALGSLCVYKSITGPCNFYTAESPQAYLAAMRAENQEETDDCPARTKDHVIKYDIIKKDQIADLQFLLSHGLDSNTLLEEDEGYNKQSLLSRAVRFNQREMARILLAKGADPFLFPKNSDEPERAAGPSAIATAIFENDPKMAGYILNQRAPQWNINLSIKDQTGAQWSPIYWAIFDNSPEMVALLLQHGANAKNALLTDVAGKKLTPLQYASGEEITIWEEEPEGLGTYKRDKRETEKLTFPDPESGDKPEDQEAKRTAKAKNLEIQRLLRERGAR
jgi:hypothetical protein